MYEPPALPTAVLVISQVYLKHFQIILRQKYEVLGNYEKKCLRSVVKELFSSKSADRVERILLTGLTSFVVNQESGNIDDKEFFRPVFAFWRGD